MEKFYFRACFRRYYKFFVKFGFRGFSDFSVLYVFMYIVCIYVYIDMYVGIYNIVYIGMCI